MPLQHLYCKSNSGSGSFKRQTVGAVLGHVKIPVFLVRMLGFDSEVPVRQRHRQPAVLRGL